MSQYVDIGAKAFVSGGVIGQYLRVKRVSGVLVLAGLTDYELGTMRDDAEEANDEVTVLLRSKAGTCIMVAAAAIAIDTLVYTAANGQISSTNATGSILVGRSLEAATASGDFIEVLRM